MLITNDIQLRMILEGAITRALHNVIQRVFQELQHSIERDIYNSYSPEDYERTYALLEAWESKTMTMMSELNFKPEWLPINPTSHQHGSVSHSGYTDIRQIIFDILEQGYGAYNYHTGKPIPARPMWDNFIATVDKKIDTWIRKALREQGMMVI